MCDQIKSKLCGWVTPFQCTQILLGDRDGFVRYWLCYWTPSQKDWVTSRRCVKRNVLRKLLIGGMQATSTKVAKLILCSKYVKHLVISSLRLSINMNRVWNFKWTYVANFSNVTKYLYYFPNTKSKIIHLVVCSLECWH